MYTKDKCNRITLRLNDDQFEFVKSNADVLGVSPSEFLRIVINTTMSTTKTALATLEARMSEQVYNSISMLDKEGDGRENDKANSDNIV